MKLAFVLLAMGGLLTSLAIILFILRANAAHDVQMFMEQHDRMAVDNLPENRDVLNHVMQQQNEAEAAVENFTISAAVSMVIGMVCEGLGIYILVDQQTPKKDPFA